MPKDPTAAGSLRDRQKAQTRDDIVAAMLEALAAGDLERVTHDALARRVGVARQTVYRHFPDRESLMRALWERVNREVSAQGLPGDEAALADQIGPLYANFDRVADLITVTQSTPQGRAMRMSVKDQRAKAFRAAAAAATEGLSDKEATQAAAVLQLLHGGQAWIEMRQQWGLSGEEAAQACAWAVRTLLADLHARRGRSLTDAAGTPAR
ncbi:MAG: helix-turn-helix transcriptional regulator [Proteobacteria bacterium]|nr:helix-turn-helix transcriptional regulator [Pseudomonadota bacterium]